MAEGQQNPPRDQHSTQRSRNISPLTERNRNSRNKPVYEMSSLVDLNGQDSSSDGDADFNENRVYDIGVSDVMVVCQFGSAFLPQLSTLDSSGDGVVNWPAGSNKDKMLDLIITTQHQQDSKTQLVFKIWIHNTLSSKSPSFHTQIIQSIHYSRCQHFIFLYEENDLSQHDVLRSYENVRQIKDNKFHSTFIAMIKDQEDKERKQEIETNKATTIMDPQIHSSLELNGQLHPESVIKDTNQSKQVLINARKTFLRSKPSDLPELMKDVLKQGYKIQEEQGQLIKQKTYSLETEVPPPEFIHIRSKHNSASSNTSSSSSDESPEEKQHQQEDHGNHHISKSTTFINTQTSNNPLSAGQKVLAELKIDWKQNIQFSKKIPEILGELETKQRWSNQTKNKMKGSKSQDLGSVRVSKHSNRSLSRANNERAYNSCQMILQSSV